MFFYYNKTQANNGKLLVLYISETKLTEEEIQHINEYQDNLLTDYIIYEGETAFVGYHIVEEDRLRKATDKELVDKGIRVLKDGEKLVDNGIVVVDRPEEYSYAYDWNGSEWVLNTSKLPQGIKHNELGFEVVPIPEEHLKSHWEYPDWIDDATDVDRVQKSLDDYLQLNNYLDGEEMKERGIFEDYKSYVNECKQYLNREKNGFMMLMAVSSEMTPKPSSKLEAYFNIKKQSNSLY